MWDISILIKTFKRPETCQRLIDSIRSFYPDVPIIVLDDSNEDSEVVAYSGVTEQILSPFDIGVSRGRNELVDHCHTKYCMILDDDCLFTSETGLNDAIMIMDSTGYDILELGELENGTITGYRGKFIYEDDVVEYVSGEPTEFCNNIFVARTEKLKECRWDEELKMGEHFAFFFNHRGKLKIGYYPRIVIEHRHVSSPDYDVYRERSTEYLKSYMKKTGIKKRIDLFGNIIEI